MFLGGGEKQLRVETYCSFCIEVSRTDPDNGSQEFRQFLLLTPRHWK